MLKKSLVLAAVLIPLSGAAQLVGKGTTNLTGVSQVTGAAAQSSVQEKISAIDSTVKTGTEVLSNAISILERKNSQPNLFYTAHGECEMPPRSERNKNRDKAIRFSVSPSEFMDEESWDYVGSARIEKLLAGIDYELESRVVGNVNGNTDIMVVIRPANPGDTLRIKTILLTSSLGIFGFMENVDDPGPGNISYDVCQEAALLRARENAESAAKITGMKLGRVDKVSHFYDPSSNRVKAEIRFELE